MKGIHYALVLTLCPGCGTHNLFTKMEKEPTKLEQAAIFLEDGDPTRAQEVILNQVAPASKIILQDEKATLDTTITYSQNLASSMEGVENGGNLLSMYANAEAQKSGVNALSIMVDIIEIDNELKAGSSLALTAKEDDDKAIATFYPAMPAECHQDATGVLESLDKAVAIILATAILLGFNSDELEEKIRDARKSVSKEDMFNAAIFSQVAVICPAMSYDTNHDKVISDEEAQAITDTQAEELYARIVKAIDWIQALVDANPGDENLAKAVKRMREYQDKIDTQAEDISLANRVRIFLVENSRT